ncbi:MAG: RNA 2',3'-cyclic phosphodiesterase [Candidatus Cybelea sp.]
MAENAPRKRRLFAGIELDGRARTACAEISEALRATGFDARYEAPEKLHVTLAFLGFVEPTRRDEVGAVLTEAAAHVVPFAISLDKLGAFPHERKPRVVYAGSREQGAAFRTLAAEIRNGYAKLGFAFESDAVAHVTLARVKTSPKPLPLVEFAPIALEIRELVLFESLPDPARNTSRYQVVATAPLAYAATGCPRPTR